jgi:hypothetical protein
MSKVPIYLLFSLVFGDNSVTDNDDDIFVYKKQFALN